MDWWPTASSNKGDLVMIHKDTKEFIKKLKIELSGCSGRVISKKIDELSGFALEWGQDLIKLRWKK